MLRAELYRAFPNRAFWLALALGVLTLGHGFIIFNGWPPGHIPGAHPLLNNAYDTWLFAFAGSWGLLAPFIAVLPFADSYVQDRTEGWLRYVLLRSPYRHYFFAKFLTNLLAGGIAVALPMLLLFVFTNIFYPRGLAPVDQSRIPSNPLPGTLGDMYRVSPDLYILFRIGLGFLFGAIYATVGLVIATLVNNRYVVLATPFLLYNIANFVLAVLGLAEWTPPATLIPDHVFTTTWLTVFGELGGIFAMSIVCLLLLARRSRIFV